METTAITPDSIDSRTAKTHGFEGLGSDDFLKLLVAQLSYQDPLEPTSNEEIVNQISSIRDIEASTTLTQTLESLAESRGFGSAAGLLGQYVSGSADGGDGAEMPKSGIVVGLRVDPDGAMMLLLDTGEELPLSEVEHVTTAQQFADAFKGRSVTGIDRSDPRNPSPVEGVVTGVTTDPAGQVMLELDTGLALRLTDVTGALSV